MTWYDVVLLIINSMNLDANLENVQINEELINRSREHEKDNEKIINLLEQILEELKNERK